MKGKSITKQEEVNERWTGTLNAFADYMPKTWPTELLRDCGIRSLLVEIAADGK
jgi:hypothetical protein